MYEPASVRRPPQISFTWMAEHFLLRRQAPSLERGSSHFLVTLNSGWFGCCSGPVRLLTFPCSYPSNKWICHTWERYRSQWLHHSALELALLDSFLLRTPQFPWEHTWLSNKARSNFDLWTDGGCCIFIAVDAVHRLVVWVCLVLMLSPSFNSEARQAQFVAYQSSLDLQNRQG